MAVNLAPDANFTRTSTGLALPVSACWWAKFDSFPAAYQTMLYHGTASYSNCLVVGAIDDGSVSATDGSFASKATTPSLSTGVWYFFGVTVNTGTGNFVLYWREEGETSLQSDAGTWAGTFAANRLCWGFAASGDTAANAHDGSLAYCRLFSGVLTPEQMLAESASATAVATEWADWPMASTASSTTDASGNARPLTFNTGAGRQTNDTDPDIALAGGPVTGTATGSYGFSATASGVRRTSGSTSGSYGFTATASGHPRTFGSAQASAGFTATASGVRRAIGQAAGPFGFETTAEGLRRVVGQASGTFGFEATAAVVRKVAGQAAGGFGFTVTASGVRRAIGQATSFFGFEATAEGLRRVVGEATGTFGFEATASGAVETDVTAGDGADVGLAEPTGFEIVTELAFFQAVAEAATPVTTATDQSGAVTVSESSRLSAITDAAGTVAVGETAGLVAVTQSSASENVQEPQ